MSMALLTVAVVASAYAEATQEVSTGQHRPGFESGI